MSGGGTGGGGTLSPAAAATLEEMLQLEMGFTREQCTAAVLALGPGAVDLEAAINYCLEYFAGSEDNETSAAAVETSERNAASSSSIVSGGGVGGTNSELVQRSASTASSTAGSSSAASSTTTAANAARASVIERLTEMGFPENWSIRAVEVVGIESGFDAALTWLLANGDSLQAEDEEEEAGDTANNNNNNNIANNNTSGEGGEGGAEASRVSGATAVTVVPSVKPSSTLSLATKPATTGSSASSSSTTTAAAATAAAASNVLPQLVCRSGWNALNLDARTNTVSVKSSNATTLFPSVVAKNVCLRKGKHYYEVTLHSDNCMQIGWVDAAFTGNASEGNGVSSLFFFFPLKRTYHPVTRLTRFLDAGRR